MGLDPERCEEGCDRASVDLEGKASCTTPQVDRKCLFTTAHSAITAFQNFRIPLDSSRLVTLVQTTFLAAVSPNAPA